MRVKPTHQSGHQYNQNANMKQRSSTNQSSTSQYFEVSQTVKSQPKLVDVNIGDLRIRLASDRGVFSYGKLDAGTKLLLSEVPSITQNELNILDLGCGWGAITCVAALKAPHAHVTAVDINERALNITKQNVASLNILNVSVVAPEHVDTNLRFHRILCNPPIRVGKPALHRMLIAWLSRLEPSGYAHLVVNRHLGSDSLAHWLTQQKYPTKKLLSRAGYRLLETQLPATPAPPPVPPPCPVLFHPSVVKAT